MDELKAAGGNCVTEMDRAINDANDYDLQVADVKVTGTTATATVRQGDEQEDRHLRLRQGEGAAGGRARSAPLAPSCV